MKIQFILSSIILMLFSFNSLYSQNCEQNSNHPNYNALEQTFDGETIIREYLLYVPSNYNPNESTALIINLHGFGDCANNYFDTVGEFYEFNKLADEQNFLVAYPQAAYRPEKEDHYWEPSDTGKEDIYENDVFFIEQLILEISSTYTINTNQIYACGYSNGGMMAYSLACNTGDLFAGISVISGTMLEEECLIANPTPLIIFHGVDDEVLPYDGNQWYQSVSQIVDFWLDKFGIPINSLVSQTLKEGDVLKDEYMNNNACITVYSIFEEYDKPGGHVWFSEEIEDISPNEIMWNFFTEQCGILSSTTEPQTSDISIVPNPFGQTIKIATPQPIIEKLQIFDMLGRIVFEDSNLNQNQTIDLEFLESSTYLLKADNSIKRIFKSE